MIIPVSTNLLDHEHAKNLYICTNFNLMKFLQICILLMLLGACESNFGEVIVRSKVQVYYLEPMTKKQAMELANYWENKRFINDKMQFLQLSGDDEIIFLKIIANDSTLLQEIPFDIQLDLHQLDSMLRRDLYPNHELQILISDRFFNKTKAL